MLRSDVSITACGNPTPPLPPNSRGPGVITRPISQRCIPNIQFYYTLATVVLLLVSFPLIMTTESFILRVHAFLCCAIIGVLAAAHWVKEEGVGSPEVQKYLPDVIILYLLLAVAFIFYATKFPECIFPDRLDIIVRIPALTSYISPVLPLFCPVVVFPLFSAKPSFSLACPLALFSHWNGALTFLIDRVPAINCGISSYQLPRTGSFPSCSPYSREEKLTLASCPVPAPMRDSWGAAVQESMMLHCGNERGQELIALFARLPAVLLRRERRRGAGT